MSECMNRKEKMGVGGIRGNFDSTKVTNKTCMVLPVDGLRFAKKEKKKIHRNFTTVESTGNQRVQNWKKAN